MSILITGMFAPSGGPGAFDLYDPADLAPGDVNVLLQLIAGGRIVAGSHATAPVGEVVIQRKTTSGAPTHSATEGALCWVTVDDVLYCNNNGTTGWTAVGTSSGSTPAQAGPPGMNGEDGEDGNPGPIGPIGPRGLPGVPGASAFFSEPEMEDPPPALSIGGDLRAYWRVHRASQDFGLTGIITPASIGPGVVNDWNPTGLSTATVIRIIKSGATSLGGLAGGVTGRVIAIYNSDASDTLIILNEAATSTAGMRFHLPTTALGDFPLTPGDGVILIYDGVLSRWVPLAPVGATNGRFQSIQVFSTVGAFTWTRPTGIGSILVRMVGGGGGGGGADSGAGAGTGGGGAGGSYCEKFISSAPASCTGVVGTGGAGGTAGPNTGTNGTDSTFTDGGAINMHGVGGIGGEGGVNSAAPAWGAGGSAAPSTGGDVNSSAQAGLFGMVISSTVCVSGQGGSSVWGGGGEARYGGPHNGGTYTGGAGIAGDGFGSGGGGGCSVTGVGADRAGGAGRQGLVVVWEFTA